MSREQIKAVALSLFAQYGYGETSMSTIARLVGIQKSSIYAHFESKEELFLAVFDEVLDTYARQMEEVVQEMATASVEQKLYRLLQITCRSYLQYEEGTALLKKAMLFSPSSLKERLRTQFLRYEEHTNDILVPIFTQGLASAELRPARIEDLEAAFYCLSDGLFLELFYYSEELFAEKFESAWRIFWAGISKETSKLWDNIRTSQINQT